MELDSIDASSPRKSAGNVVTLPCICVSGSPSSKVTSEAVIATTFASGTCSRTHLCVCVHIYYILEYCGCVCVCEAII